MFMCRCGILSYLCLMCCRCTKPACWFEWRRLTTDSRQPREQWSYRKVVCWWTFVSVLHWGCSRGKLQQMWSMYCTTLDCAMDSIPCNASSDMPHAVSCLWLQMVIWSLIWQNGEVELKITWRTFFLFSEWQTTQKDLHFVTACNQ